MEANGSLERYERETGGLRLSCSVNGYEGTEPALKRALMPDVEGRYWRTDDGLWSAVMDTRGDPGDGTGAELTCVFQALGESPSSTVALSWEWPAWSKDHYVLVPGAVYAGNRFEVRPLPYAPCWTKLDSTIRRALTGTPAASIRPRSSRSSWESPSRCRAFLCTSVTWQSRATSFSWHGPRHHLICPPSPRSSRTFTATPGSQVLV